MTTSTPTSLNLYFIRHGETEWAISGWHTGRSDIPLTPNGEAEVRKWAPYLHAIPFTHVLASPLQRAMRTCELVGLPVAPVREPDLMEWDYGDYEKRRSVDIRKERANWDVFRDGCPHGESAAHVEARADRFIARLLTWEGNIAIFSHGQFGSVLAMRWLGLPTVTARHFPLTTASLSLLTFDTHHPDIPVIALWNAAADTLISAARGRPDAHAMTVAQGAIQRWDNEGGEIPGPR